MSKHNVKILLLLIAVCAMALFGCSVKDNENAAAEKQPVNEEKTSSVAFQEKKENKDSVQKKKDEAVPYLLVDDDFNITGTKHFDGLQNIDLCMERVVREEDHPLYKKGFAIADGAFENCDSLQQLTFSSASNVTKVADNAFQGCDKKLIVYCSKGSYLWKRLQELGIHTEDINPMKDIEDSRDVAEKYPEYRQDFDDYFVLGAEGAVVGYTDYHFDYIEKTTVRLPEEAKKIGKLVFGHSYEMGEIVLPEQMEEICEHAFVASGVKKITFQGQNLKKIGDGAFSALDSTVKKLDLPEGVEEIGDRAFASSDIEEIIIPKTVETVGKDFLDFTCTRKLIVCGRDTQFQKWAADYRAAADNWDKKTEIYCCKNSKADTFFKKMGFPVKYLK